MRKNCVLVRPLFILILQKQRVGDEGVRSCVKLKACDSDYVNGRVYAFVLAQPVPDLRESIIYFPLNSTECEALTFTDQGVNREIEISVARLKYSRLVKINLPPPWEFN